MVILSNRINRPYQCTINSALLIRYGHDMNDTYHDTEAKLRGLGLLDTLFDTKIVDTLDTLHKNRLKKEEKYGQEIQEI